MNDFLDRVRIELRGMRGQHDARGGLVQEFRQIRAAVVAKDLLDDLGHASRRVEVVGLAEGCVLEGVEQYDLALDELQEEKDRIALRDIRERGVLREEPLHDGAGRLLLLQAFATVLGKNRQEPPHPLQQVVRQAE